MRRIFLLPAALLLCYCVHAVASEPQHEPVITHRVSLEFKNGKYSSIFGIIPKEYNLESQESREIVQRLKDDGQFMLDLTSSDARRILSLPDETPTVETSPKPLTGKTLRAFKQGERWDYEILGLSEPSETETREAVRLLARFVPGANPFSKLNWKSDGTAEVDVAAVLTFLGYTDVHVIYGTASARKPGESADPESPVNLSIEASFESGQGASKLSAELKADGTFKLNPDNPSLQSLTLDGKLGLHGERGLPDGRIVPYNLITDFAYKSVSAELPP